MPDNDDVAGKEPFFGFLEWMSVWALISGGLFPVLWRLDGVVRVIAIAVFASIVAASAVALANSDGDVDRGDRLNRVRGAGCAAGGPPPDPLGAVDLPTSALVAATMLTLSDLVAARFGPSSRSSCG